MVYSDQNGTVELEDGILGLVKRNVSNSGLDNEIFMQ